MWLEWWGDLIWSEVDTYENRDKYKGKDKDRDKDMLKLCQLVGWFWSVAGGKQASITKLKKEIRTAARAI